MNKKLLVIILALLSIGSIGGVTAYQTFYNLDNIQAVINNSNITIGENNTITYLNPTPTISDIISDNSMTIKQPNQAQSISEPETTAIPTVTPIPTATPKPTPKPTPIAEQITITYNQTKMYTEPSMYNGTVKHIGITITISNTTVGLYNSFFYLLDANGQPLPTYWYKGGYVRSGDTLEFQVPNTITGSQDYQLMNTNEDPHFNISLVSANP
jgi:hypothetical protein